MSIEHILITAHSGAEGTAANSREYLQLALSLNPDVIEVDLNTDSNGNRVLSHDAPSGDDAVSFDEVIHMMSRYQGFLNLDVKNTEAVRGLGKLLGDHDLRDRCFLTGLLFDDIEQVRADIIGLRYMVNVVSRTLEKYNPNNTEDSEELCQRVAASGAFGININYHLLTGCLLAAAHAASLKVYVWTVDDEADIQAMISMGVDSITTKNMQLTKLVMGLQ